MNRIDLETAVGIFVLAGLLCLGYLSFSLGKLEIVGGDTFTVYADFSSVAGLRKGGSVEIAGVEVGSVERIEIMDYKAHVFMKIQKGIAVPEDTIASIRSRGLIGDKYVNLAPGGSDKLIASGGRIRETEASLDLEGLIGAFIHGSAK